MCPPPVLWAAVTSPARTGSGVPVRLVDRAPVVDAVTLLAGLVPPPLFAHASFDGYQPDPAEPTQQAALVAVRAFVEVVQRSEGPRRESSGTRGRWWRWARGPGGPLPGRRPSGAHPAGIYLDGGFGVGKTHLLAALWHESPGPKSFATFVELTHLVGA